MKLQTPSVVEIENQVMGVFMSVYATLLSWFNFICTTYTATCFGRTTIFKQKIYY
jgi:hypothetical protein